MLLFLTDLSLSLPMLVQMVRVSIQFKAQSPLIVPVATVHPFFVINERTKKVSAKPVTINHK